MKIKTVAHILCIISGGLLCGYGVYTLHINGELPLIAYSQKTTVQTEVKQPKLQPATTEPVKRQTMIFKAPELPSDMTFVHTGYIPTNIDNAGYTTKISKDDHNRVTTIETLYDENHPIRFDILTNISDSVTSKLNIAQNIITLPRYILNKGLNPVINATTDAIQTSSLPVAIKLTFKYTNDTDIVPEYTHVEVFTTKTKDIAYKITLHSIDPKGPINYKTGGFY